MRKITVNLLNQWVSQMRSDFDKDTRFQIRVTIYELKLFTNSCILKSHTGIRASELGKYNN